MLEMQNLIPSSKVSEMDFFPCSCPFGGAGEGFARSQLQSTGIVLQLAEQDWFRGWKMSSCLESGTSLLEVSTLHPAMLLDTVSPLLHMVVDHAFCALPCHRDCRNLLLLIPLQRSTHSAFLLLTGDPQFQDGEGGRGTAVVSTTFLRLQM